MQNCKTFCVFNTCSLTDFIEFLKNIIFNLIIINLCNHHGLQWEAGDDPRTAWRDILLHRQWLVPKTMTLSHMLRDIKNESG